MSILLATDPKEARRQVQRKLEAATDEDVMAVHRMLLEMEARRLADELGKEMQQDWDSGRITSDNIAKAVLEHRRTNPYR